MGPPGGRQFPPQQSGINNGWPPQQQQQQQQQPSQSQHQIPPQHPHYPHHQQQQMQHQARIRFQQQQQSMPGTSNPNIPNPVSAIQYARPQLQQRLPMMPISSSTSAGSSSSHPTITKPIAKKVKNPTIEKEKIQTWHDYPADKRQLKKHKFAPDVFPQEPQQEEDKMTPERIKRGFALPPNFIRDEGESAMKHFIREDKSGEKGGDKVDDFLHKAAVFIQSVSQKKSGLLDNKKIKEISFVPFKDPQKKAQWLDDLARGKSYHSLTKKIPILPIEECMEEVFEHKISIPQVVWLLKVSHFAPPDIPQQKEKQQISSKNKKQMESCDYTVVFIKLIKDLLDKMEDETTANLAKQKWKYYSMLIRHSVMCVQT
uniref:Mediator complex subunit 15 n=1 Tax=Panagrolaimus sp. PS1159 TaxID=55785 RepID=A0AC35EWJ3_9BILA